MIGELGDVLLQVMLHAQIGEDEGMFTIDDVVESISAKMVRRHPHVFGDVQVRDAEDVVGQLAKNQRRREGREIRRAHFFISRCGKIIAEFNACRSVSKKSS